MKTVELFSGTESFSKIARKLGHETFTIDYEKKLNPNLVCDLLKDKNNEIVWDKIKNADIVWMSPPCTVFSIASGNTHWTKDRQAKTQNAIDGRELLKFCEEIANYCIIANKIFFIENPRARARWFLPVEWRKEVWYCQYGDKRAKPTDIWTNLNIEFKTCHNFKKGQPKHCHHESSPRGSKTGTQGLKNAKERGVIPENLFIEIFKVVEER
jgi:hypothetical protein